MAGTELRAASIWEHNEHKQQKEQKECTCVGSPHVGGREVEQEEWTHSWQSRHTWGQDRNLLTDLTLPFTWQTRGYLADY